MKKFILFCLIPLSLSGAATACKNTTALPFSKKYDCRVAGETEPRTAEEYARRGIHHAQEEVNLACAFDACTEALRLDGKNSTAFACRGLVYKSRQQYDLSLRDFDEAIRLEPDNPVYYSNRSRILQEKSQYGKALEDMNFVINNEPTDSPIAHYNYSSRADLYSEVGDFENALKDQTRAIELKPDYYFYYSRRAETYRRLNKNELAAADEQKAAELELVEKSRPSNATAEELENDVAAVLNEKTINLPKPVYPPAARAAGAGGAVSVRVDVDEKGNVTSATAISGHPLLRASSEAAARQAKFKPTLGGSRKSVKVSGIIVFNFSNA